jgi:hypothetical protein
VPRVRTHCTRTVRDGAGAASGLTATSDRGGGKVISGTTATVSPAATNPRATVTSLTS